MVHGISTARAVPEHVLHVVETCVESGDLELPILPQVATEVLQHCRSADADARTISEILHRDQAIAGNVLRLANSPLFGTSQQITSLQQAVSRIGMARLTEVMIVVSTSGRVFEVPERWRELVGDLRKHSLVTGLFGREIARVTRSNVETAFLQGLLHDMGKPALLDLLVRSVPGCDSLDDDCVCALLVEFHARVGAQMCESWGLATPIHDAVLHQHDWQSSDQRPEGAALVQLASRLADVAAADRAPTPEDVLDDPAVVELNVYPDELAGVCALHDQILEAADLLH